MATDVQGELVGDRLAVLVDMLPLHVQRHQGVGNYAPFLLQLREIHAGHLRGFLDPGGTARTLDGHGGVRHCAGCEVEWEVCDVALENEPGARGR